MKSLLVVERQSTLSSALRTRTAELGSPAEVVLVTDPLAAGRALRQRPFDLVLAPCRVAGTSAVELALAAAAPGSPIPRLALIGAGESEADRATMAGGRIFLVESLDEVLSLTQETLSPASGEGIDLLGLTRIAHASMASLAVRLQCRHGEGVLRFEDGFPVHAATSELTGDDAFFQMVLWGSGLVEELPAAEGSQLADNLSRPSVELVEEAARFHALFMPDGQRPAPLTLPGPDTVRSDVTVAWGRLVKQGGGARLLIACPADCAGGCCRRLAEHLAHLLDAPLPRGLEPEVGPSFMRLHPAAGGALSLTLVPTTPRNRFLFESLARGAQGVVLCADCQDDQDWRALLPAHVPSAVAMSGDPCTWPVPALLERLASEEP